MNLLEAWTLAGPIALFLGLTVLLVVGRRQRRTNLKTRGKKRKRRVGFVPGAAAGAAFQFLAVIYRPSQAFLVKAQIRQEEDADEDDDGDPETPIKHLHRQLRRIRRGERVEQLVWRLE